jgi:L-asparaginase II
VGHEVLARVVRSGFVESVHHGSAVALDASGATVVALGDPDAPVFPRSSAKPLQAVAMLRAGLRLDGQTLALAAASHSGERFHLDGVRRILAAAGLDPSDLQNSSDYPLDDQERSAWQCAGRAPSALAQNCSGKHAAMLATCVENGWPTTTYRDPDHPLQVLISETIAELAGEAVAATGVDGCGAPLFACSLTGLARAFARVATARRGTPEQRMTAAIRAYPEWLGGTGRDVTALLRALPGIIAKDGAEAVYAAALPDGRAAALKVADGGQRARPVVMAALLHKLGETAELLDQMAGPPVLGRGEPVGRVEAVPM